MFSITYPAFPTKKTAPRRCQQRAGNFRFWERLRLQLLQFREVLDGADHLDVYEPYLLQQGFLTRTPRGRCVTRKTYEHLGIQQLGQQEIDI